LTNAVTGDVGLNSFDMHVDVSGSVTDDPNAIVLDDNFNSLGWRECHRSMPAKHWKRVEHDRIESAARGCQGLQERNRATGGVIEMPRYVPELAVV
jgi:hypothetical protein